MIFDFRVFLGDNFNGRGQQADQLLHAMDGLEIERALVCPFKPISYNFDQANRDIAGITKKHADRLVGAVRVDPWQPDATGTLLRGLEHYGMRALFLHPWEENFRADQDILDPLLEIAEVQKIPVIIAAGYPWVSEALQILTLALKWPDVPIVMTNGGQINISGLGQADANLALSQSSNIYFDTAGIYRQDFIEEAIERFGSGRVLFASNSPYFDQRYEIKRVLMAKITDEDRDYVLSKNAKVLLKYYD